MNYVDTFTSNGSKLINHPEVVSKIKDGYGKPISLQIAPTSRCNLNCCFCSNINRNKHEDLHHYDIRVFLEKMKKVFDLKTVEWTGGGDPTQYHHINEVMIIAGIIGLEQGFITNGIQLKSKVGSAALSYLTWIRVSMNCLDYVDQIDLPDLNCTLGFSYVMNDKTTSEVLDRLHVHVLKYKPSYVRIVSNCQVTNEEQIVNNRKLGILVKEWGSPYFYQEKTFNRPKNCWWGYFKPFLLHNGWIYPCSSVVLNSDSEQSFHDKYKWIRMENIGKLYGNKMQSFNSKNCTHCVFTDQNNLVDSIKNPTSMGNFV